METTFIRYNTVILRLLYLNNKLILIVRGIIVKISKVRIWVLRLIFGDKIEG